MSQLPPEVVVRALLPEGVHYVLPRRIVQSFGEPFRRGVTIGLRVGLGIILLGVVIFVVAAWNLLAAGRPWWLGSPGFSIALVVIGCGSVLAGLTSFLLYGHAEIKLRRRELSAIERAGPLRWTWKRPTNSIRVLDVRRVNDDPVFAGPMADVCRIEAGGMYMAVGYPRDVCLGIADDLREHWPTIEGEDDARERPEIVNTLPERPVLPPVKDRQERPADSEIVVEDSLGSLTIRIPPAGMRGGTRSMFWFSLFWLGLMLFIAGVWLAILWNGPVGGLLIALSIVGFCAAIGVAMLVGAINMARRYAAIAVAGDRLMVVEKGIFGTKREQWNRDEVEAVVAAPGGMKINEVPVIELQIYSPYGKFSALAGRADDELEWIATVIRQRLAIQSQPLA